MSLFLVTGVSFLFVACLWPRTRPTNLPLPPGPRGKLFSGVKDQLPKSEPWKTYAQWGANYGGPILCFRVYNRLTVVLNTRAAVHDLFGSRADIYSGRPMSWMYGVICGRANSIFNIPASHPRHKIYRRLLQRGLGPEAVKTYAPNLEDEAGVLIRGMQHTPEQYEKHIRRNAAAVIMKVAFGYPISDEDDPFISVAEQASKISGWALAPGRWLVDYWPILRFIPSWFPFAHFKRQGSEWRSTLNFLSDIPHNWVKSQIAAGTNIPSFTSQLLRPEMAEEAEDIVKWSAGALYAGAADTTVSATISFVMLMALHPAVQKRAQAEIDSITSGIPQFADVYRLPYLLAVLKEVMRYAPVANLALPHQVTQDDTYAGYRIPAGATIVPNVYAILHDAETYPDPFLFDPDRFVAGAGPAQPDPGKYIWGFGRRTCPGIRFAEPVLLLNMASILYHFTISRNSKAHVVVEFTTGITSHIKPFGIHLTPRHCEEMKS
ncbi:cytochrome P450 [Mycena maculata]|uniref:Cytochrome P450 n=1 Tax=Mycena maculata TaxID=230809 RepID=A0AAD7HLV3_9AGAR|nr:cytochrome P450 [Mycena maculata]